VLYNDLRIPPPGRMKMSDPVKLEIFSDYV
jgi:hypothetical protein